MEHLPMDQSMTTGPDYRFVLLGASNLTLGLPRLVHSLRSSFPGTLEILAAHGHGRSYLKWSYVLYRGLPSIRDCGLWEALNERPPAKQTFAVVTDLGCDLFYGALPEQIIESVSECLVRLQQHSTQVTFVRPPLQALYKIGSWRYFIVKNIFFPGPTIPWDIMREYITQVDSGVFDIAHRLQQTSIAPRLEWYGFDPIHMTNSKRSQAWTEILSAWNLPQHVQVTPPSFSKSYHIWTRKAAERSVCRKHQKDPQPASYWAKGCSLSIY